MDIKEQLIVSREERVAVLCLNNPDKLNALSAPLGEHIIATLDELSNDDSVGVIVFEGKGRHFCAGGDINRMKRLIDSGEYLTEASLASLDNMAYAIRTCPKPTVAIVHGIATGGGCALAMACDFRFASVRSKFGMAFINLGIPGDTGAIYLLNRLVGPAQAAKMMMTGELVGGEEAHRIGLVSYLVEDDKLREEAFAFAHRLSVKSAVGLAAQKRIINKYFFGEDFERYFFDEREEMAAASRCPDFTEAVYAFLEKRSPEFNKK